MNNLDQNPGALLFPSLRSSKSSVSHSWFRKALKHAVTDLGLDPSKFSGHSLRAGGATDLFVARTPYAIIQKMGRWKSNCFLIYFRDDEHVAFHAAAGFARLVRRQSI
jgi:integrase